MSESEFPITLNQLQQNNSFIETACGKISPLQSIYPKYIFNDYYLAGKIRLGLFQIQTAWRMNTLTRLVPIFCCRFIAQIYLCAFNNNYLSYVRLLYESYFFPVSLHKTTKIQQTMPNQNCQCCHRIFSKYRWISQKNH